MAVEGMERVMEVEGRVGEATGAEATGVGGMEVEATEEEGRV